LGRYAAHAERVPGIVHTIHGLPFHPYESRLRNALYRWLERKAARWSHKIVCVADAMTDQAVAAGVADRAKFVTVYSGMETEAFLDCDWQRRAMRYRLGVRDDEFVIGKIARLFELKGYEYVIEAAKRIRDAHPNVRFLFVGDGILRKALEDQAKRLGVRDWILFAGLVPASQVPTYISAMDALVHASLREGLARVLPQALLAGKPVVSFDVDGAREVVVHGETGYLVPPKSVDGLVVSVCELIENPARAAAMAAKGRELCRERFRWQTMVSQLDALYRELLATSGASCAPSRGTR
jgi:glycosyltransferase involved in cell wall biosynthesis